MNPSPVPDFRAHSLLIGKARPFGKGENSAIAKQPADGPIRITHLGMANDEQADRVNHGGPDKALHLYSLDHYDFWRERLDDHPLLASPGAFGENIAASGADERALCLGDRFRFGTALLEISHGRQPCWKLDWRFGRKDVMKTIVRTGRCGIYFRVLEEGVAQAGEPLTLIERTLPEWSVARLFTLLIAGGHKGDPDGVAMLATMPVLAQAWRTRAAALAA